jgi:hypothetical protein
MQDLKNLPNIYQNEKVYITNVAEKKETSHA